MVEKTKTESNFSLYNKKMYAKEESLKDSWGPPKWRELWFLRKRWSGFSVVLVVRGVPLVRQPHNLPVAVVRSFYGRSTDGYFVGSIRLEPCASIS
jgi:hypothetical protein